MWNKPLRNFCVAGVIALLIMSGMSAWRPDAADQANAASVTSLEARVSELSSKVLREQVIDLPEDAGVWHTIVVYPSATPSDVASRRLASALASNDRLRSLAAQTKTHVYALGDPLWRERLQPHYGAAVPALIVQRPDGKVCYKASGANLPGNAEQLADEVAAAIGNCRPRPEPQPAPSPSPAPTIPDIAPRPAPSGGSDTHALWMIVVPIVAGMLGLYQEWKQSKA